MNYENLTVEANEITETEVPNTTFSILFRKYLFDWIGIGVLYLLTFGLTQFANTHERYKVPNDPSTSYPYRPDSITRMSLIFITVVLPITIVIVIQPVLDKRHKFWNRTCDIHHFCLGLFQATSLQEIAVIALKIAVGRFRPSAEERLVAHVANFNTGFPSGHTSTAVASMIFFGLYLCGKFEVFRFSYKSDSVSNEDRFQYSFTFGASIIAFWIPVAIASWVFITRINDYAHDFSDVNAGIIVGIGAAIFSYHLVYPTVCHQYCFCPRPIAELQKRE